jgi:hypothetical protein
MAKDKYDTLFQSNNLNSIVRFIHQIDITKKYYNNRFRSWEDVGKEVDKVIKTQFASR